MSIDQKTNPLAKDKDVGSLPTPDNGNKVYYDHMVKGFGVRVTKAGARAFILNYRIDGRERRFTIGSYPDWSLTTAREEAKRLKRQIDTGTDPLAEREERRDAVTVDQLCDVFIEEHLPKKAPKTQLDYTHIIDTYIRPELKHEPVAAIDFTHANKIFRKVTKAGKKTTANRTMAVLSKMFSEAQKRKWATSNPTKGIEKNEEVKRERFLEEKPGELERLLDALAKLKDQQAANIFRLILLTGCRKTEALAATWGMFNLSEGTWTKAAHYTKQRRTHVVPLSAPARQLLAEIKAGAGDDVTDSSFVFPVKFVSTKKTTKEHRGHRINIKDQWSAVLKAAKLQDLHIHDLRHSFASFLVAEGMSLPLIGRLLGHTQASTTNRYAHLALDPLRAATERVGNIVSPRKAVVDDAQGAEVVDLRGEKVRM